MSGAPREELHQAASVGLCVCEDTMGPFTVVFTRLNVSLCRPRRPWKRLDRGLASRFRHATQHDCTARLRQKKKRALLHFCLKERITEVSPREAGQVVTVPRTLAGSNVIRHDQQIEFTCSSLFLNGPLSPLGREAHVNYICLVVFFFYPMTPAAAKHSVTATPGTCTKASMPLANGIPPSRTPSGTVWNTAAESALENGGQQRLEREPVLLGARWKRRVARKQAGNRVHLRVRVSQL